MKKDFFKVLPLALIGLLNCCGGYSSRSQAIDETKLLQQLDGRGCFYLSSYNRRESWKYSLRDKETSEIRDNLSCYPNNSWFSFLSPGRIGCRVHAAYCLLDSGTSSSTAISGFIDALVVDADDFDYGGFRGSDLRAVSTHALGSIGDIEGIEPLIHLIESDVDNRDLGLLALMQFGSRAQSASHAIEKIALEEGLSKSVTLEALAAVDPGGSVEILKKALSHDKPEIRRTALKKLAESGIGSIVEEIIDGLDSIDTASSAAMMLKTEHLQNERIVSLLVDILQRPRSSKEIVVAQLEVARSLWNMKQAPYSLCSSLVKILDTRNAELWSRVVMAIGASCGSNKEALKALIPFLDSEAEYKRVSVVEALKLSEVSAVEKHKILSPLSTDHSSIVRKAVTKALEPLAVSSNQSAPIVIGVQPDYQKLFDRQQKHLELLTSLEIKTKGIRTLTANLLREQPASLRDVGSSYTSQSSMFKKGTVEILLPSKRRTSEVYVASGYREEVVEIETPLRKWKIITSNTAYGSPIKVFGDLRNKPVFVDTFPVVTFRNIGSRKQIGGLSGQFRNGQLSTSLSYLRREERDGVKWNVFGKFSQYNTYMFWVNDEGLIGRTESYFSGGNYSDMELEAHLKRPFEVVILSNFELNAEVEEAIFEYNPPANAEGKLYIYNGDGIIEEREI